MFRTQPIDNTVVVTMNVKEIEQTYLAEGS